MVSTVKSYVWMLRREGQNENLPVCHLCEIADKTMKLNVRSMRQISAAKIQYHVLEAIQSDLDYDGLISVWQLPIDGP